MLDTAPTTPDFNEKDAGASFDHEITTLLETPAPAPAEPAPTPVTEERPAEAAPSGQPRDEKGRFRPAPPAEPPAATTPPAATAPAAPPAAAPTEPAPVAEDLPEASYRADGKDFSIPGSKVGEDGVFIPTAQWEAHQRLLAAGQVHQGSFQRKLSESAQNFQREKVRADAAEASKGALWDKLMAMAKDGTLAEWLDQNLVQNLEVLIARSEAEGQKLRLKDYEEREKAREREATESQREPQMQTALANAIQHYGAKAGLSQDRMRQLYARLNTPDYRRALFFEATEDDPIQGIRKGETVIALGLVEDEVAWAGNGAQPAVDKVAAAAAANAKAAGTPAATPPTVTARGGPAPSAKAPVKQYKDGYEAVDKIFGDDF